MPTSSMFDRVRFTANGAPGTGNVVVLAAVAGYRTPAGASIVDATMCTWLGVDGTAWEVWSGTKSGTTVNRTTLRSSSTGSAISFSANVIVSLVDSAFDLTEVTSTTIQGLVELATDAEAQAMTDTARAVTPSNLASIDALQADQETGTSVTRFVTPGVQHFHQSATKVWIVFDGTGTPSVTVSYGVGGSFSITDGGVGLWTINFGGTLAFSTANFSTGGAGSSMYICNASTTTAIAVQNRNTAGTLVDAAGLSAQGWGDF